MPAGSRTALGIDVGGTKIRVARIDAYGRMSERVVEPVEARREAFGIQIARLAHGLRRTSDAAIGVGIPGRVRAGSGEILSAGYLDIAGLDLCRLLEDTAKLPAFIENDATMALLAEVDARADAEDRLVMMLTVGTGIGGAAVQDRQPWYGGGMSGQFGHMVVDSQGPLCNCGRRGCVETFSSGSALARHIQEAGLPAGTSVDQVLEGVYGGDPCCAAIADRWAMPMQRAIETLSAVADPGLIVIGGGLGAAMMKALERLPNRSDWFRTQVEPARLGDDAGVVGAGLRALSFIGGNGGESV